MAGQILRVILSPKGVAEGAGPEIGQQGGIGRHCSPDAERVAGHRRDPRGITVVPQPSYTPSSGSVSAVNSRRRSGSRSSAGSIVQVARQSQSSDASLRETSLARPRRRSALAIRPAAGSEGR